MCEAADRLLGRVRDGPDDAGETAGRGQRGALGVDRDRARLARELAPGRRVVDDEPGVADDSPPALPGTARGSSSQSTVPSASTTRLAVTSVPGARPETSAPARPKETSRPSGSGSAACSPTRAALAPPLRAAPSSTASAQASVSCSVASYRSVHARLLTVSFTLEVVAIVAAGSKPEWIPQCSQRWSFPGP